MPTNPRAYQRTYMREYRALKRSLGLCTECKEESAYGFVRCPTHLEYKANWNRMAYRRGRRSHRAAADAAGAEGEVEVEGVASHRSTCYIARRRRGERR